jgi:hypothetical protein
MANRWARAAKISLVSLGGLASAASVLQGLPAFWWLGTLLVTLGSYWLLAHRDPWVSLSWLREKVYSVGLAQAERPRWMGIRATIFHAAPVYFSAGLLLLCVSQLDLSTGRASLVALARTVGTVNLQLLLVLVGTWLLFRACEIARAVQRHVNASGQINN